MVLALHCVETERRSGHVQKERNREKYSLNEEVLSKRTHQRAAGPGSSRVMAHSTQGFSQVFRTKILGIDKAIKNREADNILEINIRLWITQNGFDKKENRAHE